MSKRLIIVSNRLPVHVSTKDGKVAVRSSSGGLVSAMDSFLNAENASAFHNVVWLGCPECSQKQWKEIQSGLDQSKYTYHPVFPDRKAYTGYYNGFANSTIWPLFHYFTTLCEFELSHYVAYRDVNRVFADALLEEIRDNDLIWIHDYHLMLLPQMIREKKPHASIGFFLHIPFPSSEIYRILPKEWREAILRGMLGADLIGFHTNDYVMHFLKSVQMILGSDNEMRNIRYENRIVRTEIFPISIDFDKFHNAFDNKIVSRRRNELREAFPDKKIIFSIDRLDYTKGVIDRLRAYEYFLQKYPRFRKEVVFLMVVVPSRDNIRKYSERKRAIDELIGFLNGKFGTMKWQPVIYRYTSIKFEELVALYTLCNLALITPLRDGMNLVAKEFVASRKDAQGVLILSEMAGAASELSEALMVIPNDREDTAEKILQALEMPPEEQKKRILAMQGRIRNYTVVDWATDFISQLQDIKNEQGRMRVNYLDDRNRRRLSRVYQNARSRLFLLDYDGTLVHLQKHPSDAVPTAEVLQVLRQLCSIRSNSVFIISGRDKDTLMQWFDGVPVNLVAEHGATIYYNDGSIDRNEALSISWKEKAQEIIAKYVQRCPKSMMEEKQYSVAWHFRNADRELGDLRANQLFLELNEVFANSDLQVIRGNKLIEVRPAGVNKGAAVRKILSQGNYDFVVGIGDDRTDEDMFKVLDGYNMWSIKIGNDITSARYNLAQPFEVISLLQELVSEPSPTVHHENA